MARHLTMEERDRIPQLKHQGVRQQEIARAIQRSPSTISRELQRNGSADGYFAAQAQQRATSRRRKRPLVRKMDVPEIKEAVCRGLTQFWSPEQIAGRLELETRGGRPRVSARTIYTWIGRDKHRDYWQSFLRRRGKLGPRSPRPERIGAPLKDRPQVIEVRLWLGDFEGGTVLGPGRGGLATLVDLKSRYTIIVKIRSKHADQAQEKIKGRLKQLDTNRRHSVTFDNGSEFPHCDQLVNAPVSSSTCVTRASRISAARTRTRMV